MKAAARCDRITTKHSGMNRFRIIVAEDDADDFATLKDAFSELENPNQLERSPDGEQLMVSLYEHLELHRIPDLIILDINMPRLNGIDTLQRIREKDACEKIPVFMYSTSNDVEQMRRCYQLGADRFVTKGNHYNHVCSFAANVMQYLSDRKTPVRPFIPHLEAGSPGARSEM